MKKRRLHIKEMSRYRGSEESRMFAMEEKLARIHDEVWTLFELVMKLQREVEGLKVKCRKPKPRSRSRRKPRR